MDNCDRVKVINQALQAEFTPEQVLVMDDSEQHAGHSGHGGAGHFRVQIVSDYFVGMGRIERHRAVYRSVSALMGIEIHALSIEAKTPQEVRDGS